MRAASVSDYRELARRRLPKILFEYIDGGSFAEVTLGRNVRDLEEVALRQRVMVDTTELSMATETLGQSVTLPIGLAPVGMAGMYARRGEVQAARAAAAAGVPFCLSSAGVCSIEEVAAAGVPPWFQLYMLKDRGYMRELLARARDLACPVLVFTVDLPTPGTRYRDLRSGFTGASKLASAFARFCGGVSHPRWTWDVFVRGRPHVLGSVAAAVKSDRVSDYMAWGARNFDRSVTWKDMAWVRESWDGPIVVKGVLDPQDAKLALRSGAQGVVVSNHGGRQLDGVRSSIAALPAIADAVGGELEIYLDGGIRSGLDVLKALALGAKACFVGRAWAYALSAGGELEVRRMLEILSSELAVAMILAGCDDVRKAGPALLDSCSLPSRGWGDLGAADRFAEP